MVEFFYMIQQFQGEVCWLQGEVEEQRYQIDCLKEQGWDCYIDFDQCIFDFFEKVLVQFVVLQFVVIGLEVSGVGIEICEYWQLEVDEWKLYQQIVDLIWKDKKYDEVISWLYEFIDKYFEGDLMVNVYYWLGEVYLVKFQLEQVKQVFIIVVIWYLDY